MEAAAAAAKRVWLNAEFFSTRLETRTKEFIARLQVGG